MRKLAAFLFILVFCVALGYLVIKSRTSHAHRLMHQQLQYSTPEPAPRQLTDQPK